MTPGRAVAKLLGEVMRVLVTGHLGYIGTVMVPMPTEGCL